MQKPDDTFVLVQYGHQGHFLSGWINLDLPEHDIRKPLLFPNNHVDAFFLEHVIEHVNSKEAYSFFEEAYRCLKIGGVLRLAFPDIIKLNETIDDQYINNSVQKGWGTNIFKNMATKWGHKTLWSKEIMKIMLSSVGFAVRDCEYRISEVSYLNNLETHNRGFEVDIDKYETSIVEGVKK